MIEIVHYAAPDSAYPEFKKGTGLRPELTPRSDRSAIDTLHRRLACNNRLVHYYSMHRYRIMKTNTVPAILYTSDESEVTCLVCREVCREVWRAREVVNFAKANIWR